VSISSRILEFESNVSTSLQRVGISVAYVPRQVVSYNRQTVPHTGVDPGPFCVGSA
jgi:hypothetical protein